MKVKVVSQWKTIMSWVMLRNEIYVDWNMFVWVANFEVVPGKETKISKGTIIIILSPILRLTWNAVRSTGIKLKNIPI